MLSTEEGLARGGVTAQRPAEPPARARHRRWAGGTDRCVRAGQAQGTGHGGRGRLRGGRNQPDRGARGLALRHRRPPLLHQGARGRGALARDPAGRRLHHAAADEPHRLQRQVVRLPAQGDQRAAQPRALAGLPVHPVVRLGAHPSAQGPDQARGLGGRTIRLAALPDLLQDLLGEGLGRSLQRGRGRLGGAADQEPLAAQGDHQRGAAQAQSEEHRVADRGVPVPQVRPRDDVGDRRGDRQGPGQHDRAGREGQGRPPRERPSHRRHHRRDRGLRRGRRRQGVQPRATSAKRSTTRPTRSSRRWPSPR